MTSASQNPGRGGHDGDDPFAQSVLDGLSARSKWLASKYLYDAMGSVLFDAICLLDEYYPPEAEQEILRLCSGEAARFIGEGSVVIEPGSGSSVKTRLLLDALEKPSAYVPVDISATHLEAAAGQLRGAYPDLRVLPVAADFTQAWTLPEETGSGARLVFFPGSTIGNFSSEQARGFLSGLRRGLAPRALLIGVDLKKDAAPLLAAYDDALGVTAAFNLNLLRRINRDLAADFDLSAFRHEARWNEAASRVEMHLVSQGEQRVQVAGRTFTFAKGETIHTENSHKFSIPGFKTLAEAAGWRSVQVWTDSRSLFSVHLLEPSS